MKVKDFMRKPITVDKNEPVTVAMDKMDKNDLLQILVTNKGKFLGTLSYKDLSRELGSKKRASEPPSKFYVSTAYQKNGSAINKSEDLLKSFKTLSDRREHIVPVVEGEKVVGSVDSLDMLKFVDLDEDIVKISTEYPKPLRPDDRVVHARRKMLDDDINALPIVEEDKILGLLTHKEIAKALRSFRKLVPGKNQDKRIRNLLINDVMRSGLIRVNSKASIREVAEILMEKRSPFTAIELGKKYGIISAHDIIDYWCEM